MGRLTCPFCTPSPDDVIIDHELAYALYDRYPVNPGHVLVIPWRHVAGWFEATDQEQQALLAVLDRVKDLLDERYHPDGYNIGINVGEAAGQTVMHLHIHVIPRYKGDVGDPRGGVRGVIPEKQGY
jgi:diadenosine tetraphosphate (Ap4A) HIT family hydrolase